MVGLSCPRKSRGAGDGVRKYSLGQSSDARLEAGKVDEAGADDGAGEEDEVGEGDEAGEDAALLVGLDILSFSGSGGGGSSGSSGSSSGSSSSSSSSSSSRLWYSDI